MAKNKSSRLTKPNLEMGIVYAHLSRKGRKLVDALHRESGHGFEAGKFINASDFPTLIKKRYRSKYAAFVKRSKKNGLAAVYAWNQDAVATTP